MNSLLAQNASVTVSMRLGGVTNYKYACTDCWEAGNNEYTSNITAWPHNDTLTYLGKSGCLTCDKDGDCTYGMGVFLFTQTGTFDSIKVIWDYFENNTGDRCLYEKQWAADDDCFSRNFNHYNFRLLSAPSDGVYTNQTYVKYQFRNFPCVVSTDIVPFAQVTYQTTWKYAGSENQIVPTCSNQSAVFNSGTIPSWSAYLYAGVSYNFNTCSSASGEDTYMRIYGSDGYTEVASNNNGCGSASSVVFTPTSNGYYYIEVSHSNRSLTESEGTLSYSLNSTTNQTCTTAKVISTGTNYNYNTFCSSQDAPAQTCGQSANEHKDIWFKYKASSTGTLVINNSSSYNSRVSVYSGSCGSLSLQSCAYIDSYLGGTNSLTLSVCKNTNYFISVGGTYSGIGAGSLSLSLTAVNTLPTITCPSNINLFNSTGICGRIYNYTAPVGTDNCSGAVTSQVAGLTSGSTFPIGNTTNTFRVVDSDGSSAQCSFTVTVVDNEAPSITCPASITINKCSAVSYNYPNPVVNDNCGAENVTIQQTAGLASGSNFPLGTTTNTFRAIDGRPNVSSSCSFTITVNQSAPLSISCPNNKVVDANSLNCYKTIVTYPIPQVDGSPECGLQLSLIAGKMTGSEFPFGVTTNTWEVAATDGSYQTATCSFTVTVRDRQAPTIDCPDDITTSPIAGTCQAIVNYTSPTKSDNCFEASATTLVQIAGKANGASYPVGTTTNTFKATDLSGNTATCSFTVLVSDNEPPIINCPDNIELNLAADECSVLVNYITPVGTDNCSGVYTEQTQGLPSGSLFYANTTTNTFVVTDAGGMSSSCSFTVYIANANPPVISCPENIIVPGTSGGNPCSALVNYISPIGIDHCEAVNTERIAGLPSGSEFPQGETTITYVATDESGQSATCSFMVSVGSCNQAPVSKCKSLEVSAGELCIANISYLDVNDGSFDPDLDELTYTINPQGPYTLGDHTLTFTSRDAIGLEDDCIFILRVVDHTAPETPILPDVILGECYGTPATPTTNDQCMGTITGTTTNSFPILNQGTTVVNWTFEDGNGNSITVPQNFIIDDITPPSVPMLEDIEITVCQSIPNSPITQDICAGSITGQTITAFPLSTPGNHVITWTFDDGNGNSISVNQNVNVVIPNVPGQYLDLDNCQITPCPPGTYCPGGTTEPIPCPAGSYSSISGSSICLSCPAGKYQSEEGQTFCASCPKGTYSDVVGSINCASCPAGKYQSEEGQTSCASCPKGTYSDVVGSISCASCPAGKYQSEEGQTSCASCPKGTYSTVVGSISCASCPAGKYQSEEGQTFCASCPKGTYSDVVGSINCASCPAGKYQSEEGQTSCASCPKGTYSNVDGSISCASCPAGKYQSDEGQTSCASCPKGTYSDVDGSISCSSCPAGKFQSEEGQTSCANCPPGKYSSAIGSINCAACPAQTFNPVYGASACLACPSGTWNPNEGQIICPDCILSITCNNTVTVNTDAGFCYASNVNLGSPTTIATCPLANISNNAPSIYGIGNTTLTWTVTDVSGVSAQCNQTVSVNKLADQNLLYAYVILSNDEVKMKECIVESGGIGVMTANKKISLEQNTKVIAANTFVKSANIDIKSGSSATLQINGVVPSSIKPPFFENLTPANNDVKINDNSAPVNLNLASYGNLEIGKNVVATFTGQRTVYIKELQMKEGSRLKFDQATNIIIDKKLDADDLIKINDEARSGIQFYVEEAVSFKKSVIVKANIFTKKELKLEKASASARSYMIGQFIADKVDAKEFVNWNWDNNYCPVISSSVVPVFQQEYSFEGLDERSTSAGRFSGLEFNVFPNPTDQLINIEIMESSKTNGTIKLLNGMGLELITQYIELGKGNSMKYMFDVNEIPSGLYYIKVCVQDRTRIKPITILR